MVCSDTQPRDPVCEMAAPTWHHHTTGSNGSKKEWQASHIWQTQWGGWVGPQSRHTTQNYKNREQIPSYYGWNREGWSKAGGQKGSGRPREGCYDAGDSADARMIITVQVGLLAEILYNHLLGCYHQGNWGKVMQDFGIIAYKSANLLLIFFYIYLLIYASVCTCLP